FRQAGHSWASMRHLPCCPRPGRSGSGAPHAGPAIARPESLREVVHPSEILDPVAVLPGEEPHVDEHEDDAAEVLRGRDAPVGEDGRRQEAELFEREIAAGPGELAAGEMAAGGEPSLRVLQRGEDEEIGALVKAPVALLELAERRLERGEGAHGCASGRRLSPDTRARAPAARGVGSRSAWASTSSMVSTGVISSSCFTSSGTSTRSLLLRAGTSTRFTPARAAAVSFSFRPPIGSTRPRSVSSPVMARSLRAGRRHRGDASAVAIVIPAEGPALGTAPAGTCRCTSVSVNASCGMPSAADRARSRLHAACADSFITSPSWPVRVITPFPGIWIASTNMMSPPTGVHASPVATPTSGLRPATSLCTFGKLAYFSRFLAEIFTVSARPSTTSNA